MTKNPKSVGQLIDKIAWLGSKISTNYSLNIHVKTDKSTGYKYEFVITFRWSPSELPEWVQIRDWLHYTCMLTEEQAEYWEDWILDRQRDFDNLIRRLKSGEPIQQETRGQGGAETS